MFEGVLLKRLLLKGCCRWRTAVYIEVTKVIEMKQPPQFHVRQS